MVAQTGGQVLYETAHAHPEGKSTVSRLALTASEYGYDGLVVRNHGDTPASYDPGQIRETYDIDIVTAVEIRADDPQQASGFLGAHREDKALIILHGGTPELNRFGVEQEAVDVLAHPMRGEGDFNHVLAREAIESGVRIEFNLSAVLSDAGGTRVQTLSDLRKLREIVQYYETPYVVSADAQSHLQLRASRELMAVGESIGFNADEITQGLGEWHRLAKQNRTRQSEEFVQPGVRIVDDADDEDESAGSPE